MSRSKKFHAIAGITFLVLITSGLIGYIVYWAFLDWEFWFRAIGVPLIFLVFIALCMYGVYGVACAFDWYQSVKSKKASKE